MSRLRALLAAIDTPPGIFLAGWSLLVTGLALRSVSLALITGGALLIGVVIVGALKR